MGRQAAVVQAAPNDPLFLLDPKNVPQPSFLSDKWLPISGALCGFVPPLVRNSGRKRPWYAGIQVTLGLTVLGAVVGWLVDKKSQAYWADRDATLLDYVKRHPEDFKPKERILVGDMLKPWVPAR